MNNPQDFRSMTADSIGKDLLSALLTELRLLPKPWPKLSESKQNHIIDRLRARVESNVKMGVHLLASKGRTEVIGSIQQITINNGVKAVIKIDPRNEFMHQLFDSAGNSVAIIIAGAEDALAGINEIKGEADQRAMDLGHEYHDNDGGGMDSDDAIDAELLSLPDPKDIPPSHEELQQAFIDGYNAAREGRSRSECPVIRHELVTQWIKGWETNKDDMERAKK